MKKIKLLFLMVLIITLCTGCSIEYNINITKDKIEEVIEVTDTISNIRSKNDILNDYSMWYPTFVNFIKEGETIELENFNKKVDGIEYHDKKIKEISNGYQYTYSYTYDIADYHDSYALANVFIDSTAIDSGGSIILKTSEKNLLCQNTNFNSLKVNINIDEDFYELNYTNSKKIKNNTYTWILDKGNCNNSKIILTLDRKITSNNSSSSQNKDENNVFENIQHTTDSYALYIVLVIILIVGYFGYKWFLVFKEKNNNID